MGRCVLRRWFYWLSAVGLSLGLGTEAVLAQPLPACQPPDAGEYLLMVVNQDQLTLRQLQQVVPRGASTNICDYLGIPVVRVGGFTTSQSANTWAQYVTNTMSLRSFVARAASAPTTPAPITPTPQPLGTGFAVLVNYFDRPAIAAQVQQVSGRAVGLVSYEQRSYLLASYTTDLAIASNLLQTLSDRGFSAMIVDGRRVLLLRSTIAGQ